MPSETNVQTLSQPAKIKDTLAAQQKDYDYDCTPCRLMGSAVFTGLGIYSYASGMSQLREREAEILKSGSRVTMGARRFGIFGLSGILVAMGAYRLVN